ncbi:ABC-type Mn/Zn transport system, ATPase component [Hahella chejuensis KCTC 2396]|uniref:Zinc import ATP-binding protein ZnuC 2 n=1 Tax=Hahella chejuensis (strain KCTC 2396) TaxID=349521 RepID=ZNUC2_HAHCH|nr:ATP-binding cassette domain-containing protein [Hahella chejuensis]Q2SI12.1 RecName: Full=Zinc import ATP-binding protein ZnuC 2 [Hahella chejuensis KCTC 2396]ABC29712.1 ABC-type Mn/Zn transport system, ATPase component [Hahella chejuensis KCTC 2396]
MLIGCASLTIQLGKRTILKDISMGVEPGEIVTIIGPNGSGKTTLLRAMIGAVAPRSGRLIRAPGLTLGYAPQTLHIDETLPMTVQRFMSLPKLGTASDIDAALSQAGVPGLEKQQIMSLSGGQLQRVLLARALLGRPRLLLLDEATQGLDPRGVADFYRQITSVRDELGCAIIMVSHELHLVMRKTDRVICLNGHICCEGEPDIVSRSPEYLALFGIDNDDEAAIALHSHGRGRSHHGSLSRAG